MCGPSVNESKKLQVAPKRALLHVEMAEVSVEQVGLDEVDVEPAVINDWFVRGAGRYSGVVTKAGRSGFFNMEYMEFMRGGRRTRDGKHVHVVLGYPFDEIKLRLGTPQPPKEVAVE